MDNNKKIEIVNGNKNDLKISKVSLGLDVEKEDMQENNQNQKNVIVPKSQSDKNE